MKRIYVYGIVAVLVVIASPFVEREIELILLRKNVNHEMGLFFRITDDGKSLSIIPVHNGYIMAAPPEIQLTKGRIIEAQWDKPGTFHLKVVLERGSESLEKISDKDTSVEYR